MLSTIEIVAGLVYNNKKLSNWKIERANPKHQLSGLRMLRLLKQNYQSKKNKEAYKFDYQNNCYIFTKDFQLFCKRFYNKRMKEKEKKNKGLA